MSLPEASLPWMGLGLTSNLDPSVPPNPWRLAEARPGLIDFVEYSAPLSIDHARQHAPQFAELWAKRAELPVLFHPVHLNLWGPELESPDRLHALDAHAREVESPWVGNDVGWWHAKGEAFPGYLYLSPPLTRAGLDACVAHALHVQAHLTLPLVLENPAVIAARGEQHVLDFMAQLHARTGRRLLLDLGHLFSYQLARGLPMDAGLDGFPLDQVVEIHLAGGVVTRRGERAIYVDDHTQPVREELFELLSRVLPRCSSLRALTFEGDGHPDAIAARTLQRLRTLVPPRDRAPEVVVPAEAASTPMPVALRGDDDCLRVFEESYGLKPPSEDPVGVEADLDFRLAVLAQSIDRVYPLSRLLLAGTREGLLGFSRSAGFRACFAEDSRSVERAFMGWAIEQLRSSPDPALEAVLAMEGYRAQTGRPFPGKPPVDLAEAEFAARALRRHLSDRAWVSGDVEKGGLEGLWQVVRRAAR